MRSKRSLRSGFLAGLMFLVGCGSVCLDQSVCRPEKEAVPVTTDLGTGPSPMDGSGSVADLAQSVPDLAINQACVPCRWEEPYTGCIPSLCEKRTTGELCCSGR